ncbi:ATPase inhibitor subunit zeta [Rhizobium helianthi]|uniref:ATPase inhibitor subunit zeta n=1 Tax=Rhizobium helianthi TaxID=1132695 RepID=A0ABW4LZC1_9HYPH
MNTISLKERAKAQELKYSFEEAFRFRAQVRRNRMIGLWAGEVLGQQDPLLYAENLANWAIEHPSDAELLMKLRRDFDDAKLPLDDAELTTRMHGLLKEILEEMKSG